MWQSLRLKLLALFVVMVVTFSVFAYYLVQQRMAVDAETKEAISNATSSLTQLLQVDGTFQTIHIFAREYLLFTTDREVYRTRTEEAVRKLISLMAELEKGATLTEARPHLERLQRDLTIFYDVTNRILIAGAAGDIRGGTAIILTEGHAIGSAIYQSLNSLEGLFYDASNNAMLNLHAASERSLTSMISMVVVGLLLFALLVGYFIKGVITPLLHLKAELVHVAQGDLTSKYVGLTRQDEVGELSRALQETIANLRSLISGAQVASFTLAERSVLISGSIQEVAAGNDSQASITQEIARTLEQLAASTEEIAANAQSAAAAGAKAQDAASEGAFKVGNSINSLKTVQESVLALSAVSKQIGGIVSAIDDISDQTNLLALNAAIEAARAGEHGRGFAVVADAVRSLAEQSRQSTKEISKLIASIQRQIDQAVTISTQGAEGAKSAQEALENIIKHISIISDMIEGISAAGEEQAAAAGEVAASMENLGAITEEVAASSQESGVAVEQLIQLAKNLQAAAGQFRV